MLVSFGTIKSFDHTKLTNNPPPIEVNPYLRAVSQQKIEFKQSYLDFFTQTHKKYKDTDKYMSVLVYGSLGCVLGSAIYTKRKCNKFIQKIKSAIKNKV